MRITKIELENFRAFYDHYIIDLGKTGNNLLIYGENGSGKSSLFKALKYFLDSDNKNLDYSHFKNIFNPKKEGYIKLSIRKDKNSSEKIVTWSNEIKETHDNIIREASKTKGFIDYKKLLETYFLHIDENEVNIYDLFIDKLIANVENPMSSKIFIEEYNELIDFKHGEHNEILKSFNDGIYIKLNEIEKKANDILNEFNYKIKISFKFEGIKKFKIKDRDDRIKNKKILMKIDFFDKKELDQHHLILNEAKLSAIAISIFFATILEQPSSDLKILALDDVLIGLDMSNRMPILDILEKYFDKYQIFFMTYDKTWFDIIKQKMISWKHIEFFNSSNDKFEIPIYADNQNFIERAEYYLSKGDLKSSVVYLRSEFENQLKKFCDKHNLLVKYKINQRKLTTEDLLKPIKEKIINSSLIKEIELHRTVILNPLSHSSIVNIESKEVQKSIDIIKKFIEYIKQINIEQSTIHKKASLDTVVEHLDIDFSFEFDILNKLIFIEDTETLNKFLHNEILNNIEHFSNKELEKVFDELRIGLKVSLIDTVSEANIIRIFNKKDWKYEEKILWCNFIKYLYEQNKIQDPFLIQKLEEKKALKKEWGGWNNQEQYINCEIENQEEIPF